MKKLLKGDYRKVVRYDDETVLLKKGTDQLCLFTNTGVANAVERTIIEV